MDTNKSLGAMLSAAMLCAALSGAAHSQPYPSKPITMLNPSAVGGVSDTGARLFAEVVSRSLGQRILVENRTGAGGALAARALVAAPPDGYTLMASQNGVHEILPAAGVFPFDGYSDFTFITPLFRSDQFVIARGDLGASSLQDLIAKGKATRGGLTYGDTNLGSPGSIMMAGLKVRAGFPFEAITYSGGGPQMMTDLLSSRLDFAAPTFPLFGQHLDKIRVLAVTSEARSARLPSVPTLAEAGYGDVFVDVWWGVVGPKGMPKDITDRLHAEFVKASRDPEVVARLDAVNIQIKTLPSSEAFRERTIANQKTIGATIKAAGIKFE